MYNNREMFLEKQINLYSVLIDDLEGSKMNHKEKKDLVNIKNLYKEYITEYKTILCEKVEV